MNLRLVQRPSTRQTTPQSIRFAFATIYMAILCGVIYFYGLLWPTGEPLANRSGSLAIVLILLLALERVEQKRFGYEAPKPWTVAFLLARMALIELVAAIDTLGAAPFLYPIVAFSAYFGLGGGWSRLIGAAYLLLIVVRTSLRDSHWYLNPTITALFIGLALAMVFILMMAYVLRREEESRRRTERLLADLESSHLKLQAYAAQVGELAAADERNRLARDIHDSLGHYLTAVNIQLEKALAFRDRDPTQATQALRDAKEAAAEALQDVRRSVGALRDSDESFSLKTALDELIRGVSDEHLTVELCVDGDESGYSRPALMTLYRAAQEGLTNIRKHAQAQHVSLDIQLGAQQAALLLRDDGMGFDPDAMEGRETELDRRRFGLRGIKERVELVSGQMALHSSPQQGTELWVSVPKKPTRLVTGDWLTAQVSKGQ